MMLLLSLACYDPIYGEPLNDTTEPEDVSELIEDPTHDEHIQPIWENSCAGSSCHTNGGDNGGLSLDDGYSSLVGQTGNAGEVLVTNDGDVASSHLWTRLDGGGMPLGSTLDPDTLQTIRNWIEDGAPQ
jgi:hypothetical protein